MANKEFEELYQKFYNLYKILQEEVEALDATINRLSSSTKNSGVVLVIDAVDLSKGRTLFGYSIYLNNKTPITDIRSIKGTFEKTLLLAIYTGLQQGSVYAETKRGITIFHSHSWLSNYLTDLAVYPHKDKNIGKLKKELQTTIRTLNVKVERSCDNKYVNALNNTLLKEKQKIEEKEEKCLVHQELESFQKTNK